MVPTVLVVDDNPDLLEVMGLLMDGAGIGHLEAQSLAQVQALGDRLRDVTLALLDVNLGPGQPTGVDVSVWLRAQGLPCRIVFITGHAPEHPLVQQAAQGSDRVMAKPVESKQLIRIARGLE